MLYNMPLAIEDHVDFTADAIEHLQQSGLDTIEPTPRQRPGGWPTRTKSPSTPCSPRPTPGGWAPTSPAKPRVCLVYLGGA